jgi:hypothetical protein
MRIIGPISGRPIIIKHLASIINGIGPTIGVDIGIINGAQCYITNVAINYTQVYMETIFQGQTNSIIHIQVAMV